MYNPADTAERIKEYAKIQKVSVKQMLEDCDMNKNVLSTMLSRGSMPKADNIARIADYLDCSVDYLLGRTDNPKSHLATAKMLNNMVQQEIETAAAANEIWKERIAAFKAKREQDRQKKIEEFLTLKIPADWVKGATEKMIDDSVDDYLDDDHYLAGADDIDGAVLVEGVVQHKTRKAKK
jgi:transcriptional regulator with XRE-family HTH domain